MKLHPVTALFLGIALVASVLPAAEPTPSDPAARLAAARKLADGLKFQQGEIVLHSGLAKISLPAGYRYLDPAGTATVLHQLWGNPRGEGTLGMIVPANFDALRAGGWAVIITFDEDGYVKDDDASSINYDKLLAEMKEDTREASKQRVKEGYGAIELVGWAKPPRYDAATHKLHWAKELKFADSAKNTLNYNLRLLGRRGVLVLNAVAGIDELRQVEAAAPAILAMVNFQEGHRYADFTESTDKVATYGLAALVAGGIAAKAGFFKLLWVGILAFKKIIFLALIAFAGSFRKLWSWFRGRQATAAAANAGGSSDSAPPAA